jgi:uncharacterized membrane protein (DUF4010 family)
MMNVFTLPQQEQWPFLPILERFGIALSSGLFIGFEREYNQKLGARTFGLAAILGCLAGIAGTQFIWMATAIVLLVLGLINWRRLSAHNSLATTTTLSLSIVFFCAILCGLGHLYTPVLAVILCNALLIWKQPIHSFSSGLTPREIRSAILLAALSFIVMPVLPSHPVGPGHLVDPRSNWASVVIIAGIAFINYILLKSIGPRGMELTAFFGGLINSRKVIVEFILRAQNNRDALLPIIFRGAMLATSAMAIRNAIIIAVLSHSRETIILSIAPMGFMLLASTLFWRSHPAMMQEDVAPQPLNLDSPFSLSAALKFGAVFLALNVLGALAQRHFGSASFYFVCVAGGLLSSGSSIASAATLISHGELTPVIGINGVVFSSLTSILINIPLLRRIASTGAYRRKLTLSLLGIAASGAAGIAVNELWMHWHR